ncbi:MAG: adenylate/guanylate cyclase domain-containing protein [Rhodospirillales bacterium]|jgi:adenylate cyclase|nr:adenylate/guanylate cyclase domain-containing protein [Rhodospirillales bacterium]
MAREQVQRRLAAILAADVVGYSRLMGEDEEGTLAALTAHRAELIEPCIAEHRGRLVKTTGDGLLAEFASAVDAVRCAVAYQDGMRDRNAEVPNDRRIEFRIGVNLGDVMVQDDDVFGDGVNVAARLEGLAEPGRIVVSGKVHDEVRGKVEAAFNDLGPQRVKNIAEPVPAFGVRLDAGGAAPAHDPALPDRPSIAVLAFDNMSGDAEQEYFSDGIAEDIITDISKISGLFVIARNSSFAYKGETVDVKRVARELGVKFVLEGSVRKAANRVRITAQLIDGSSGGHLWAERYDRVLEDIFAIQDEITRNIVAALKVELDLDERQRIGGPATTSIEAYDLALRARELLLRHNRKDNVEATKLFERSIELDPDFITAHAELALVLYTAYLNGWNDDTEATLQRGRRLASRAVELDPSDPQGHWALAYGRLWTRDLAGAIEAIERAAALGPNYAEAYASRGYILSYASRPADAIESLEKSMRLDPQHPRIWLHFLAHAYFIAADYDEAAALLERRIRLQPETDISRVLLASCYGHLGRPRDAGDQWAEVLQINPGYSVERKARVLPYADPADWERFVEGLRKADVPVT